MNALTLTRIAAKSILKNKMRTALTMLGIIIGVGAVIIMVAIGEGAGSQIRAQVENLGTNMIVVTPGSSAAAGVSQGAQSRDALTVEDAITLRREIHLLSMLSPVIIAPTHVVGGQGNWRSAVYGVSTEYQAIRDWPVESGRFFDDSDQRSMRKVVVIGRTIAVNLFPDQDPIGQQLRLRRVPFEIIGVLSEKGQTAQGNDQDDVILAPYTTVQNRLSGRMFIAQILASTSSPEDIAAAQEEIRVVLRESHGLAAWADDDFTVRNQTEIAKAAQGTTEVMTLLLAAIASISLLVGGIGIMNIMLVSVTERTREIGIRLAVGARGSDVLTQFLVEAIVMSIIGGVLGAAVGFVGSAMLGHAMGWQTVVSPTTVFIALGFSAGVGLFFGYYPARRAAALNPIDALRYE
jgi:putative ABC transport system permease protein